MHYSAYANAEKFYNKYCEIGIENKNILDVGSYNVNGTLKPIFEKGKYIGLDMEEGRNVDVVANAHEIPFKDGHFDIVLSSSCFEHDDMFWETFLEMCRVLKPGGYLYVQAPSNGPYHGWPGDNWRFYIDSWLALEKWGIKKGYDLELVERYIDDITPPLDYEGPRVWNDSIGIFRKKEEETQDFIIKSIGTGRHNMLDRGDKKIALISSFCDDEIKLKCLKKNIIKVKEMGLDVMVLSPVLLDEEVIRLSDYVFYTKDNPVLDWPEKAIYYWTEFYHKGNKCKFSRTVSDYGWAGFHQVKQLSQIAHGMDYDYYYHMIYDLKVDDLKEYFLKQESKTIFPSKRDETTWNYGLHFMIFNKECLKLFSDLITKELYMRFNSGNAFDCLEKIAQIMNCDRGDKFVEDEIYYFENNDFFNFSPFKDFNFFIENNDKLLSNIKLWFYNMTEQINLTIRVNGIEKNEIINNFDIIDLGVNKNNIEDIEISYNSESHNITKIINKLKHSTVELL